jgi:hypothetical protein
MVGPVSRPHVTSILVLGSHLLLTTGCTSWQTQVGSAQSVLAAHPELQQVDTSYVSEPLAPPRTTVSAATIRIATSSHPRMRGVTAPRVAGDSLFGIVEGSEVEAVTSLGDITAVQMRKGSAGKTTALVAGLTIVIGLTVGSMVALSQMCYGIGC